jgi:hypothetical protein
MKKLRLAPLALLWLATPAFAQSAAAKIDAGDTAWMIAATALVLMMTIPGLALFYAGMVRKKNVLATMAQTFRGGRARVDPLDDARLYARLLGRCARARQS